MNSRCLLPPCLFLRTTAWWCLVISLALAVPLAGWGQDRRGYREDRVPVNVQESISERQRLTEAFALGVPTPSQEKALTPPTQKLLRDSSFTRLVNTDFTQMVSVGGNVTPLNQVVVSLAQPGVTLNGMFSTRPDCRYALRVGASLSAKLANNVATLFSQNTYADLSLGLTLYQPLKLRYYAQSEGEQQRIYHLTRRRFIQKNRERDGWLPQIVGLAGKIGAAPTPDDAALLLPALDSLNALQSDTEGFEKALDDALYEVEKSIKWRYKLFSWLSGGWNPKNQNIVWYDGDRAVPDRLVDRSVWSHAFGVFYNQFALKNSGPAWGNYFYRIGGEYAITDQVVAGDPVEASILNTYGQKGTETYSYSQKKDVYVSRPKKLETVRLLAQWTQFFTKKRRFGIDLRLSTTFTGKDTLNRTDAGLGIILPLVKDDKDNTKMNVILSLDFEDIFYQRRYTGEAREPYANLWNRKAFGLRVALPIVFD